MTATVLALSPHLDDAAYSAGGTLARLAHADHLVFVATVFTASVASPRGFALACQLDKGLAPDVDYMALRREEDAAAMHTLGGADHIHLGLREAPHRGYDDLPALFGPLHRDDDATTDHVATRIRALIAELTPDLVMAPQALGGHVDHLHVVRAMRLIAPLPPTLWWRDAPYAMREPGTRPPLALPTGASSLAVAIDEQLPLKLDACAAYASQNGFQFGGKEAMREALAGFARAQGAGTAAEVFLVDAAARNCLAMLLPEHVPA